MIADPSRHAFTGTAEARLRSLLGDRWDFDGSLMAAAARRPGDDPVAARSLDDFLRIVSGMLAAGGTRAEVAAFLRDEEAALLGAARSSPRELGLIARAAWLTARGMIDDDAEAEHG